MQSLKNTGNIITFYADGKDVALNGKKEKENCSSDFLKELKMNGIWCLFTNGNPSIIWAGLCVIEVNGNLLHWQQILEMAKRIKCKTNEWNYIISNVESF